LVVLKVSAIPHKTEYRVSSNVSLAGCGKNWDFLSKPVSQKILLFLKIKSRLEVEPETFGCTEIPGQPKRGIRGDPASPVNDFVNPSRRDTDVVRQSVLRNTHWDEKVLEENLSWMNRCDFASSHSDISVIVHDFNVIGVAVFPVEAHSPLIVYANAVLTASTALKLFKPVARRDS
jgi:hypothetical protein